MTAPMFTAGEVPAAPRALLSVTVPGKPVPQGSVIPRTGLNKDGYRYTRAVQPGKVLAARDVAILAFSDAWGGREPLTVPVSVHVTFRFPRPAGHYLPVNRRRTTRTLRADVPLWHTGAPDTDKLCRLVGDALEQAGVLANDSLIVAWIAWKAYGLTGETRCDVHPITRTTLEGLT